MNELYLFALANFAICMAICFIAVCRLNSMGPTVLARVKAEYAAYLSGALAASVQPWWGEWPQWGCLCIAGVLLFGLACSGHAWRRGARDNMPAIAGGRHRQEGLL